MSNETFFDSQTGRTIEYQRTRKVLVSGAPVLHPSSDGDSSYTASNLLGASVWRDPEGVEHAFMDREVTIALAQDWVSRSDEVFATLNVRAVRDLRDAGEFTVSTGEHDNPFAAIADFREQLPEAFTNLSPSLAQERLGRDTATVDVGLLETAPLDLPDNLTPEGPPLRLALDLDFYNQTEVEVPDADLYSLPNLCLGVERVWERVPAGRTPGEGVVVVVVDHPVYLPHPDLHGSGSAPEPTDHHGTRMAGVIAARRSGSGVVGVAPGVDLRSIHLTQASPPERVSALEELLDSLIGSSTRVVLNFSQAHQESLVGLRAEVEKALDAGFIVVAAAGNYKRDNLVGAGEEGLQLFPASWPGVLCVGALEMDWDGGRLVCTGRWQNLLTSAAGPRVDLAAPGGAYFTTSGTGGYAMAHATSAATAAVSGVCALLWSMKPTATREEILAALEAGLQPLHPDAGMMGRGWVQAEESLNELLA